MDEGQYQESINAQAEYDQYQLAEQEEEHICTDFARYELNGWECAECGAEIEGEPPMIEESLNK